MSLIPEKPLLFYPQLAVALGIEGAIMVQILKDLIDTGDSEASNNFLWANIAADKLATLLPFWTEDDIRRITTLLHDQGILLIGGASYRQQQVFRFAINEQIYTSHTPTQTSPPQADTRRDQTPSRYQGTRPIQSGWQPDADLIAQLGQYSIPSAFAYDQVAEFVTYWSERNEPKHSWSAKYLKHVLRLWREQQSEDNRRSKEITVTNDWRPSLDAMELLTIQADINSNFVEDAIAEFILYWQERGTVSSTWNSTFIQHVKRQWARYTNALKSDLDPCPMNADWQPDVAVFDILAMANINQQFAEGLIPEFILYWQENGQALSSWNTKFLQYSKRQWAYLGNNASGDSSDKETVTNHGTQQRPRAKGTTRYRDIAAELTDRSWAN